MQHSFPDSFLQRFQEAINSHHPVPPEAVRRFLHVFEPVQLKRGDVLVREGETCRHLYFIIRGAIRSYRKDKQGREVNLQFYFEDQLASAFRSLRLEEPSQHNLVAMSPCTVLRGAKRDYLPILESDIHFMQAVARFFQQLYFQEEAYGEMLRKLSAEEKYRYVLQEQPHLLQRVSLTQLASWLGISRESLSRIRARLTG